MTAAVKHLVEEALRLAPEEREELVETLLSHQEPDEGWAQAWEEEISRRMEDVRIGKAKLIPMEEVFRRMNEAACGERSIAWSKEIEERSKEVSSGKIECIPAEQAHRQVRQALFGTR
jgi:putative addiction module component (TIGR02574 family)